MTGNMGMIIELMVLGLLVVTIGYCMLLDRRLRAVRQDEKIMRKTVNDLSQATERAERAIESLKTTLGDCDRTLAERLRVAERYAADLEDQIRTGDDVLNRITRIVQGTAEQAAKPAQPAPVPAAGESRRPPSRVAQTLAAAQALAQHAESLSTATRRDHVA